MDALSLPIEQMMNKLPGLYICNPEWPICLFDFTFRNQNAKYVALRVEKKMTDFIIDDWFNQQMLVDLKIAELEREREQHKVFV